jgi:hypothetical protein
MPSISNRDVALGLTYLCAGLLLVAVVATARPSLASALALTKSCGAADAGRRFAGAHGKSVTAAREAGQAATCAGFGPRPRPGASLRGLVRG